MLRYPGDQDCFYLIWGHLFSWRDCEGSEGCGQDRHVDLIGGLSTREVAVDFIHTSTMADGIITTKPSLIRRARELSMFTVLRFFLLDSMAFENICQQQYSVKPDFIEVLPGVMPRIIEKLCHLVKIKIIAGGLISDRESVVAALDAGAMGVSSTSHQVWRL